VTSLLIVARIRIFRGDSSSEAKHTGDDETTGRASSSFEGYGGDIDRYWRTDLECMYQIEGQKHDSKSREFHLEPVTEIASPKRAIGRYARYIYRLSFRFMPAIDPIHVFSQEKLPSYEPTTRRDARVLMSCPGRGPGECA
jgi:hypothetical protein